MSIDVDLRPEPGPDPEPTHPADFPPGAVGAELPFDPPASFMRKLLELDDRYTLAYHPVLQLFTIWIRQGIEYKLVTPVWDPVSKQRLPLDERIIAVLIDSEPRLQGGARKMGKMALEFSQKASAARWNRTREMVADCRHKVHLKQRIYVGYGRSPGNRFSQYHS